MNRQQAKELLPIIQAFAEGKQIEKRDVGSFNCEWKETKLPAFNPAVSDYRIKPELKYRPFKDAEECWQEMQKHQPFGWLTNKKDNKKICILKLDNCNAAHINAYDIAVCTNYKCLYDDWVFIDGTPFGTKK